MDLEQTQAVDFRGLGCNHAGLGQPEAKSHSKLTVFYDVWLFLEVFASDCFETAWLHPKPLKLIFRGYS